jgi:dGTP triphosphohydrolase
MDSSEVGMKMVEYLVLRLKEVKGLNLSIATRQSITDVVELQKNRWEPSRMGMTREKTSGQKKARAAARTRARTLISRVQDGANDPWAGLSNDARALACLLEFAAARDPGAEAALRTAPDELIDTLRVVSTPATLPVVLALRQ